MCRLLPKLILFISLTFFLEKLIQFSQHSFMDWMQETVFSTGTQAILLLDLFMIISVKKFMYLFS